MTIGFAAARSSPAQPPAVPGDQASKTVETAPFKRLDKVPLVETPESLQGKRAARPTDLTPAELPANARVADARDKFSLFQIDESSYRRVLQHVPLTEQDYEVLLDLMYRLPFFDSDMIDELVQRPPAWSELADKTTNYVGGLYEISGRLRSFQNLSPPSFDEATPATRPPAKNDDEILTRQAERKAVPHVFRCRVDVEGLAQPLEVYALNVPNAWRTGKPPVGARVAFRGVLLKAGGGDDSPAFYFVAPRMMWYPDTLLGGLGLDHGLLDAIAQNATILQREQEVFYQFMTAASKYPQPDYARVQSANDRVLDLWREPERHVGELTAFHGVSRNVEKVMIEDAERATRLGFDHYYYMELFVPPMKNGKAVSLTLSIIVPELDAAGKPTKRETTEKMNFDAVPMVYYFRELPPGETPATLKNRGVTASGFFFKAWRYQSDHALTNKAHAQLIGPLLMGFSPTVDPKDVLEAKTTWPAIVVLTLIGGALVVGMYSLRLQKRASAARHAALPERIAPVENLEVR